MQHEFSWYHLHEICNRVFNTLLDSPDILGAARAAIDADDCEALGRFAQQEIIYGLLYPACQRELESMAAALADHGLGL